MTDHVVRIDVNLDLTRRGISHGMHYPADRAAERWEPLCWKGDGTPQAPAMAFLTGDPNYVTCPDCIEWMHA